MYVPSLMICVNKKITFPKIPEDVEDLDRILKATGFFEWRPSIIPIIICINQIYNTYRYFTKIILDLKFL